MAISVPAIPAVSKKGKYIFLSILGVVVIVGAWLGYKELKKISDAKKAKAAADALSEKPKYQQTPSQVAATAADTQTYSNKPNTFPISKGSTGDNVSILQYGLIDVYGATILPKYGADGNWGDETQAALVNNGWKTSYTSVNDIGAQIAAKDPTSDTATTIASTPDDTFGVFVNSPDNSDTFSNPEYSPSNSTANTKTNSGVNSNVFADLPN